MNSDKKICAKDGDELEYLALELSDVKGVLRELSQQVLRIERRVQAALPPTEKPDRRGRAKRIDEDAARRIVERLTERARKGEQIESELRSMTVKGELAALARNLGMTNAKLPPKDDLVRRISTRLRQSASVASAIREGARESGERVA